MKRSIINFLALALLPFVAQFAWAQSWPQQNVHLIVPATRVESIAWNGLFAPAGTPAAVVNQINAEVNETLREPTVRAALLKQGLVPGGGSAAEFQTLVEQEGRKWG
jgi:tripartite-type tricarboxylate transporter receptor subunit TctC